jgi:5-methylcytosine-specific restriction endonuclease McrA
MCKQEGYFVRGEEVDHVIPLHKGGKDDESNFQTLCVMCHDRKTRLDLGQRVRVAVGADGWPLGGSSRDMGARADSVARSLNPKNHEPIFS